VDVDEVADELYALAPRDFIAARDARSKEAKAAGDPAAAKQIAGLRKPTVVAWVANLLVRRRADDVAPLLELGDALREATATLSGPQLRELSRQRHQVIAALVQHARTLAQDEGQRVTEDVARGLEETLAAALADPDAGELLRQGRLTDALHHSGFGGSGEASATSGTPAGARSGRGSATTTTTGTATARQRLAADAPLAVREKADGKPPAATTKKAAAEERRRAERRTRLERDLAEAWSAARAAADARDDAGVAKDAAETAVRDARAASDDARQEVDRLRTELRAAEAGLEPARAAEKEARAADGQARQDLRAAEREAERTRRRVSELQGDLDGL
jgi:hypothetical protein